MYEAIKYLTRFIALVFLVIIAILIFAWLFSGLTGLFWSCLGLLFGVTIGVCVITLVYELRKD